jgi:DNA polymerase-3 subunit delta
MNFDQVFHLVKKKSPYPVYFLQGEEDYFIDAIVKEIETNFLEDDLKDFNQTVLYGKDCDFKQILDAVKRYPVLSSVQIVIVKEAQDLKSLDQLESYFSHLIESTILVIAHKHKTLDKRKKIYKVLEDLSKANKILFFESKKLYDNEIPDWILSYLQHKNIKTDPKSAQLLSDYLGNDLSKISNELEKLIIRFGDKALITEEIIRENIGLSKEYDIFELQSALAKKDSQKAIQIVLYYKSNPKAAPLPMLIGTLYAFFSKVYICYFLPNLYDETINTAIGQKNFGQKSGMMTRKYADQRIAVKNYSQHEIIQILHEISDFDLRSKGVGLPYLGDEFTEQKDHGDLMLELILKILNPNL